MVHIKSGMFPEIQSNHSTSKTETNVEYNNNVSDCPVVLTYLLIYKWDKYCANVYKDTFKSVKNTQRLVFNYAQIILILKFTKYKV